MQAALDALPLILGGSSSEAAGAGGSSGSSALALLQRALVALGPGDTSPPLQEGLKLLASAKRALAEVLVAAATERSWQGHAPEAAVAEAAGSGAAAAAAAAAAAEGAKHSSAEVGEETGGRTARPRPRRAAAAAAAPGITRGTRARFAWDKHPEMLARFEAAVAEHGGMLQAKVRL